MEYGQSLECKPSIDECIGRANSELELLRVSNAAELELLLVSNASSRKSNSELRLSNAAELVLLLVSNAAELELAFSSAAELEFAFSKATVTALPALDELEELLTHS